MAFPSSAIIRGADRVSVCNLKRRIDALPPLSEEAFLSGSENAEASPTFYRSCSACGQYYKSQKAWELHLSSRNHTKNTNTSSVSLDEASAPITLTLNSRKKDEPTSEAESFNPLKCLFCNVEGLSLGSNLEHMSHTHSFFIPNPEGVTDMESLLSYLFTLVSVFHECLSCGSLKFTKFAVQEHMCGKGHCKLDFENDRHKLWQFYDIDDGPNGLPNVKTAVDEDEFHLPSGKTVGPRSGGRSVHRISGKRRSVRFLRRRLITEGDSEESFPKSIDRRLTVRAGTSTSLVGVPELQQRALIAVENHILAIESRAMNERQSKVDRGGNRQKRFKVRSIGKKQGGLEKRLG